MELALVRSGQTLGNTAISPFTGHTVPYLLGI
jgi:hypothetical protein